MLVFDKVYGSEFALHIQYIIIASLVLPADVNFVPSHKTAFASCFSKINYRAIITTIQR